MNKIYKTIWNVVRHSCVVVNEKVTGAAQSSGSAPKALGFLNLSGNSRHSTPAVDRKLSLVAAAVILAVSPNIAVSALTTPTVGDLIDAYFNRQTFYYPLPATSLNTGSIELGTNVISGTVNWDSYTLASGTQTVSLGSTMTSALRGSRRNDPDNPDIHWYTYNYDIEFTNDILNNSDYNHWVSEVTKAAEAVTVSSGSISAPKLEITSGTKLTVGTLDLGSVDATGQVEVFYVGYAYDDSGQPGTGNGGDSGGHILVYSSQGAQVDKDLGTYYGTAVNNGGNVDIGTLILGNAQNTYTQNSGSTSIDNVVGPGKVIINGGDLVSNGMITITPAVAANLSVKDLSSLANLNAISYAAGTKASFGGLTGLSDQIQMNSGTLKIEGDYTQTILNAATNAVRNKYGNGINVQFTGSLITDNNLDLSNGWTTAVLNSVFTENNRDNYLFHTLNWNAQGAAQNVSAHSFGVKNIDNASSVTVSNGKTFAILGGNSGTLLGNGTFTANGGTLVFGASGLTSGGTASSVSVVNGGTLRVASGDFSISSLDISGSVNNTGTLRLNNFGFGTNGQLTSSGTLQAAQNKLFSVEGSAPVGLNVVSLGQTTPQSVRTKVTEFFRRYVPENQKVLDDIINHARFTGGKVIVTGANLTTTQRDDLIKAFKAQFGSATTLEFQGTVSGVSSDDKLTVAKVNELYDNVADLRNVIYVDRQLEAQNSSVLVGNSGLKANTGFTGLNGATATTIQDGKELTLIGGKTGTANRFALTGSTITATGNGKLILGSLAVQDNASYVGTAPTVNLTNGGQLKVAAGNYQVQNHSSNAGTTTIDSGATFLSNSVSLTNAAFQNSGNSTVSTLVAQGNSNVTNNSVLALSTLTQNAGSFVNAGTMTLANGTFNGSLNNIGTLTLTGNVTSSGALSNSGTLNNRGTLTKTNAQSIGGTVNNQGTLDFQGGFTFASNGKLSSSGTIYTNNVNNVFDSLGSNVAQDLNYVKLGSSVPQAVKTSLTDFFRKYVAGSLAESLVQHATLSGGKVVVRGVNLTTTQRDDLTAAFKKQFGNVELELLGNISGVSTNDKLTVAKVNDLYSNVSELRDVIYLDRNLEGENGAVVVGNSGLKNNTGFAGINAATSTTVQDGKELTLVGSKTTGGTRYTITDKIINAIGNGAKVILGSLGLQDSASYSGQVAQVNLSEGSELKVAAGDYNVAYLNSNGSTTTVDAGSNFSAAAIDMNGGSFVNDGKALLGTVNGTNRSSLTNNSELTVNGELNFSRLYNYGNAVLKGTANVSEYLENYSNIIANTVNVVGTLRNYGYMEANDDSTVHGVLENIGEIRLFNSDIGERGTVNNTYTLTGTGTTQVSGLLSNVAGAVATFEGEDAEVRVLDGGTISNNGTLVADKMVIEEGGYYINGNGAQSASVATFALSRAPAARAVEQLKQLEIVSGGTKTNNGTGYYGQGTIAGTFINAENAQAFGGVSDVFVDGAGLGITNTGVVHNAGTFTFGGHLENSGTIDGDGLVVFKRAGLGDDTFTNSGTIDVGDLQAENITYLQSAGSLKSGAGWFSNSEVNLTGGTIEHEVLGAGNTYNLGSGLGVNANATFTVGTLDSTSEVNINRGATLRTETIAMTGSKTTHLTGGRLSTTLDQVFGDLDYSTLNLDATNPDDRVDVTSNPAIVTGIGNVIDSVAEGIEFAWGTVAFDDASYSAVVASDALNKLISLGDIPSEHNGELEVVFNGATAEHFNVDIANTVRAKLPDGAAAYATFANETLHNESKDNPGASSLVIGTSDGSAQVVVPTNGTPNILDTSMGFMNVVGVTDGLYVNNGNHLVLVGKAQPNPNLAPIELADGAVWVGGQNDAVQSKLTLGSYGSDTATKGHLAELNLGIDPTTRDGGAAGSLVVKNGLFTIDTFRNGSEATIGSADDRTAELRVGDYQSVSAGTLKNEGVFHADNISTIDHGNELHNQNVMTAGTVDWTGTFENYGQADINNLTLRGEGDGPNADAINAEGASLNVGTLTIAGNGTSGADGDHAIRGNLTNNGELAVNNAASIEGELVNNSSLSAKELTVKGAADEGGNFLNNAIASLGSLTSEIGSKVTNAVEGVMTIAGLNSSASIEGTFENEGALKLESKNGTTVAENGVLNNSGTIESSDTFTVAGGELTNSGSFENSEAINVSDGKVHNLGSMELNGLNLTGGQIVNDASAYFKDAGLTHIEMAEAEAVAVENAGTLDLASLELVKGQISGGTVGVKGQTEAEIFADGSIDADSVGFKDLNNEGSIAVSGIFESEQTTNKGSVQIAESGELVLAEGDTFTNEADGVVSSTGDVHVSGEFVNKGTTDIAQLNLNSTGVLTSQGTTELQNVNAVEGSTINAESGTITVANLKAEGATYNQTGGSFSANKGWFNNSTLNIMGGVLDASQVKDEDGNVTGLLGSNVVNISGENSTPVIDNEDTVENKLHYKDGLTQVIAGVVNSDTTVNIMSGGVLDVEKIELDGTTADSINMKGGVLQTSADQIFSSVTTQAIRLDATKPEDGVVQLPTTVLTATTVGAVKDEIKTGLNVESGNLALDDEWFSASLIVSVTDKLNQAFENAASLTVNFLGQMAAPFTITTANDLEKEGLDVVLSPGIVLNTTTLHNEFADEYDKETDSDQTVKGLVIGGQAEDPSTANSMNISMGFKDITHADKVTIEGGKELALVGNAVNAIPEASFGDDANKLLKDAADGGSIDVNNGTFSFGSHGGVTPTVGWILSSNVAENGALEAKNGEFADWQITNNGSVHVHSNAILHTNSLTGSGSTVNEGKLSLDEKDGNLPVFDVTGNFLNKGQNSVLNASKVDKVTVSGTHANEGKADYNDMLIAEGGSSNNSGTEKGNILTVEGTHANSGTSIWNGVTVADSGKGENSGSMDVGSVFDVLGEFVNKGVDAVLDATKTAVTTVAGVLRNEGTANYDDMTIVSGGKSDNSGFEKGDILTIADGAEHTNSGTSIWNGQTVKEGGSATVEEGGKETINDEYVVEGDKTNKGEVDATGVENTEVTGTLDNQGTSNYDDMTVEAGGKSDNSGYEKGDILTIADGGEHINSGISIWNNQTVKEGGSATVEEGGKETINDKYVVEGDKTNKGEIDATGVENTEVTGNLDNQGKSEYDDMTIGDGGKSDNSGYEKGDILTIDKGGEHDNSGTSIWNNVVVAGGDVNNTGDIDTGKLTIDDGLVKIDGGSLKAEETDLNGGDLVIGNDKDPTPENRVVAEIDPKDDVIDTNIYVKNNGDLNLGPQGGLEWADELGAPTVPGGTPSRLVITTNVTTGPGGGIAVGPNVWTDKDNHVQIGNGDLYFATDSLTVIDANILTDGKSAFNTTSDIAKVTVEPGANLILGNLEEVGDYTIVNNYITGGNESDGMWTGGWTGENLYALPQDGSGINWVLTLHNDPNRIWVNAVLDDVRSVYPNVAIPNIANDSMLNCKSGDAGADFVCRVLRDKELSVDDKQKVLNSVANIAFAGGAMSVSMNDLTTATDSIEGRVSMRNEAFTEDGLMREWERGSNLWIDVVGGKQRYKSLSATGISKAGYDTNSYGFVMGYDYKLAEKSVILGGAVSYNHGSLDSTGDVLKTKNKYDSFGLHAYGAYAPVEKVNLIGTISWMRNSSGITQSIGAAGFNKAEADVRSNLFSLGARAEATLPVGKANVVPHAGLRYVWAKSSPYDTKVDGKKVWGNTTDATNTFQIPVGVAVRADIATANGWNVRPQADVTLIPQAGSTKQKTKLSNANGVTDQLSGEFAGKFGTNVTLGVQSDKGMATIGARYGFTGGTKGKADHAFKIEARYRF